VLLARSPFKPFSASLLVPDCAEVCAPCACADPPGADPAAVLPDDAKTDGRSRNRGSLKRKRYDFAFKSELLEELEQATLRGETLYSVAERAGVHESSLVSWRHEAAAIHAKAADKRKKRLKTTPGAGRPARWVEMEKRLKADITAYRRAPAPLGSVV
jgi:transposase-like protein